MLRVPLHASEIFTTDFMQRCLSTHDSSGDPSWNAARHGNMPSRGTTLCPPFPPPLLTEWTRLKLTSGSWKDALATTVGVSILGLYHPHPPSA